MEGLRTSFISLMKVLGALDRPKGHNKLFIQSLLGFKGYVPLISIPHPNMVLSTPQIYLGKHLRAM